MDYDDFDLTIKKTDGKYLVTAEWRGTEAEAPFVLPWDDDDARAHDIQGMGHTRARARSAQPIEEAAHVAESVGLRLFDAVFTGPVRERYSNAYTLANQEERGVRLRLRTEADRRLMDIPWEYLYDKGRGEYLALAKLTQVVRYPVAPSAITPAKLSVPLRVLVAISTAAPQNTEPLEVEEEWQRLAGDALGSARRDGLIFLRRVRGNLYDITKALEETDYHVFHYVGHSDLDPRTNDGVLLLEGPNGGTVTRSANDLAQMLKPFKSLQLAVFNSCEGARSSAEDPYAGVAMSMVQKGIPAVIAMQFEITDAAAITFAEEFYTEIAEGNPVDLALLKARRSIFASSKDIEWGTPVLFLRSPDGRVFEPEELAPERRVQLRKLAHSYELGQASMTQGDWAAAAGHFESIVVDDPEFADTPARLREASSHLDGAVRHDEEQQSEGRDQPPAPVPDPGKLVRTLVTVAIAILAIVVIVALAIQVFGDS